MTPTSTAFATRPEANANTPNASNIANNSNNSNGNRQQTKMLYKRRQLSGYESSSPEDNCDDEEVDETFVALQKLLKALNRNARQSAQVVPTANTSSVGDQVTTNNRAMGISRSNDVAANPSPDVLSPQDEQRLSQEEILESRRQERERFRHMLFSKRSRPRSRRTAHYLQSEEEEEDDEPVSSVESTISNRVINGSFSRLNVHVISRDRWAREEVERLPIVLLPENGKVVSPAENPKLNVCFTKEFMELHDDLMAQLNALPEMSDHSRLLTPPQSTWYMQMRDMDGIHC